MGMFDTYEPAGTLRCPVCHSELTDWQGKDGPCALFVWRQGVAEPVSQDAGEVNIPSAQRRRFSLPETFEIYSYDCRCAHPVEAICTCREGVWRETELITAANAEQKKHERKSDFKQRLAWLSGKAR